MFVPVSIKDKLAAGRTFAYHLSALGSQYEQAQNMSSE